MADTEISRFCPIRLPANYPRLVSGFACGGEPGSRVCLGCGALDWRTSAEFGGPLVDWLSGAVSNQLCSQEIIEAWNIEKASILSVRAAG